MDTFEIGQRVVVRTPGPDASLRQRHHRRRPGEVKGISGSSVTVLLDENPNCMIAVGRGGKFMEVPQPPRLRTFDADELVGE